MKFEYKPRYWDQEKEERENRLERLDPQKSGDIESAKNRISEAFSRGSNNKLFDMERRRKARKSNFLRLAVILALALMAYLVLTVYLPRTGLYFE